jgi:hypothetical protein
MSQHGPRRVCASKQRDYARDACGDLTLHTREWLRASKQRHAGARGARCVRAPPHTRLQQPSLYARNIGGLPHDCAARRGRAHARHEDVVEEGHEGRLRVERRKRRSAMHVKSSTVPICRKSWPSARFLSLKSANICLIPRVEKRKKHANLVATLCARLSTSHYCDALARLRRVHVTPCHAASATPECR